MTENEDRIQGFASDDAFKREFCRSLAKMGAIRFGITRVKGRAFSPYFIDLSPLRSSADEFRRAVLVLKEILETEVGVERFRRMAAAAMNAIPYASVLSYSLRVPMLFMKSGSGTGREKMVSGILHPGDHIVLIDEVISTGITAVTAAKKIRTEGAIVDDMVVLLEDIRGGREKLTTEKIKLHSFITINEVADQLNQMSVITDDELKAIYKSAKKKR
jgi:orotate phosphoribosyltransferase